MSAIAVTEVETICRAPDAAGATRRRSALSRLDLQRARAVFLRFLEALVPPGAPPPSPADEADWPRFPGF